MLALPHSILTHCRYRGGYRRNNYHQSGEGEGEGEAQDVRGTLLVTASESNCRHRVVGPRPFSKVLSPRSKYPSQQYLTSQEAILQYTEARRLISQLASCLVLPHFSERDRNPMEFLLTLDPESIGVEEVQPTEPRDSAYSSSSRSPEFKSLSWEVQSLEVQSMCSSATQFLSLDTTTPHLTGIVSSRQLLDTYSLSCYHDIGPLSPWPICCIEFTLNLDAVRL